MQQAKNTREFVQTLPPLQHVHLRPDVRRPPRPPPPPPPGEVSPDVPAPDGDKSVAGEGAAERAGDRAGRHVLRRGGKGRRIYQKAGNFDLSFSATLNTLKGKKTPQ